MCDLTTTVGEDSPGKFHQTRALVVFKFSRLTRYLREGLEDRLHDVTTGASNGRDRGLWSQVEKYGS